jgi:hypothetical protein
LTKNRSRAKFVDRDLRIKKRNRLSQKHVQLIMVHPVSGVRNLDEPGIGNGVFSWIRYGYREEALQTPEEQSGTHNPAIELNAIVDAVPVGRENACIVIELPHQRTVRVPVGAVQGQVARHFVGEMWIGFLHSRDRSAEVRVGLCLAFFGLADRFDPDPHPL